MPISTNSPFVLDLDRNGLEDIGFLRLDGSEFPSLHALISPQSAPGLVQAGSSFAPEPWFTALWFELDLDGDGLSDILGSSDGLAGVSYSTASGTGPHLLLPDANFLDLGDFNSDGYLDFFKVNPLDTPLFGGTPTIDILYGNGP